MLNHDVRNACIGRYRSEERLKGFEATGGGANCTNPDRLQQWIRVQIWRARHWLHSESLPKLGELRYFQALGLGFS